jgi:3',5'-cyclic-AMP phosphodiesterase
VTRDITEQSLSWVHFGDLHITTEREQNYLDLLALIHEANRHLAGHVDFALLPGDNADDGVEAEYRLIRGALAGLEVPLHIIPGDHDRKQGDLRAFHSGLCAPALPRAMSVGRCRCLFLDVVSAGSGGPDFRLGSTQLSWLRDTLSDAQGAREPSLLFMHCYPADLQADRDAVQRLIRDGGVRVVDMGHTHYNELSNDGHTIFATTRSTGQIEEGPAGFSLAAFERGVFSWRFKPLRTAWPLVLITSPADRRLVTDARGPERLIAGQFRISARVWGRSGISECRCRIDGGAWMKMQAGASPTQWSGVCEASAGPFSLTVEAVDRKGYRDAETIQVATPGHRFPRRTADGSDADSVGAWPEKHLLGTQLGPNRNGKHW